jgi:hypothetical protein
MPLIRLLLVALPSLALAQTPPPGPSPLPEASARPVLGEIALAPSRLELKLKPGGSQTVVVSVVSSGRVEMAPVRLLASLGDWQMDSKGEVTFLKPGSTPGSAADWIIYSPVELTLKGGETHPIRITVDVPADAAPGDHTAAVFVEERPAEIKANQNVKQIIFHFRLAALIYVMVEPLTQKGALVALDAAVTGGQLSITPKLKNEGNSHIRPLQGYELLDKDGRIVASQEPSEGYPVLGNSEYSPVLAVDKKLEPGEYSVRYRVDFRDGSGKVVEGRKAVVVPGKGK